MGEPAPAATTNPAGGRRLTGSADPPPAFGSGDRQSREELLAAPVRRPRPSLLDAPLQSLAGVGPKLAAAAADAGIGALGDLLLRVPHAYRDRAELSQLADLRIGEEATVMVEVRECRLRPTRRRGLTIVEAKVFDDSGPATATWFNQAWLAEKLTPGRRVLLRGQLDRRGFRVSEHELLDDEAGDDSLERERPLDGAAPGRRPPPGIHTTGLVPVHPATEKLRVQRLREWVWQAAGLAPEAAIEPLPADLRTRHELAGAADALVAVHFPQSGAEAEAARRRLCFEELVLYQAALATRRRSRRSARPGARLGIPGELTGRWLGSLPFELTGDQRRALKQIDADADSGEPMQRLLMGEVGSGKAQPLDSLVLTPSGFRPMGEIQVGDMVVNPTGEQTRVLGVFPQGLREVWRVGFSDGTSVECDGAHLWEVRTSCARHRGNAPKVKTTEEIAGQLTHPNGAAKWHVELPRAAPLDNDGPRPLDPYLLGLLLGDGGLSIPDRVRFTTADRELLNALRDALPRQCRLVRESHRPYDWRIVAAPAKHDSDALRTARRGDSQSMARAYAGGASYPMIAKQVGLGAGTVRYHVLRAGGRSRPSHRPGSPLHKALLQLDLMGKSARDKSVPPSYLNAPVAARHAVLQGLLDTDGTLNAKQGSNVTFASASKQLAEDVAWLVRSLGGHARIRQRRVRGNPYWHVSVALPPDFAPFRLRRKADLVVPRTKYANRAKAIISVTRLEPKQVQCIAVAHPNQLYITNDFTVTHNTVVALYAMLRALEAGYQAALMAPTETLAEQHAATLDRLLAAEALPFALVTGGSAGAARREALDRLRSGELGLVVGTHALIEPEVRFARLGLCVVDEQHRFGVRQRAALDAKGPDGMAPHALHMTATPIPRTLSLTAYGDLDSTQLRELPAGRRPVKTWWVEEDRRDGAYEFVRERLREGRQAFVVCPLVSESEKLQSRAATAEAERLAAGEFADFEVGVLHGQMPSARKAEAMRRFAEGRTDVLVATSVVEVGIDVPNATVMVIEGAERYGVSQLHQLRGRVGRGGHESYCILFADEAGELARRRLEALAGERDGFKLAEVDLALRGEGEILGTRQHGLPRFAVAALPEDTAALLAARQEVLELLRRHGSLEAPQLGPLMDAARRRFGDEAVDPIPP